MHWVIRNIILEKRNKNCKITGHWEQNVLRQSWTIIREQLKRDRKCWQYGNKEKSSFKKVAKRDLGKGSKCEKQIDWQENIFAETGVAYVKKS